MKFAKVEIVMSLRMGAERLYGWMPSLILTSHYWRSEVNSKRQSTFTDTEEDAGKLIKDVIKEVFDKNLE